MIAPSPLWASTRYSHFALMRRPSRDFGDVYDKRTPNHTRRRLRTLLGDVEEHLAENGPWKYRLSVIYYAPEVDLEVYVLRIRAGFE